MVWEEEVLIGDASLLAFLISLIFAYPLYRLLLRMKSRQTVSEYLPEHQRKQGTPTMGGLIIVAGCLAGFLYLIARSRPSSMPDSLRATELIFVALMLLVGYGFIGFLDDFIVPRMTGKRGLGWKQKILLEAAFAGVAVGYLNDWRLGPAFWLGSFLVLFYSNAYNFADGLDGLAGSLLIAFGFGIAAIAQLSGSSFEVTALIAVMICASLPFLFMNAPPARIFMGDVGSLPIGACLGLAVSEILTYRVEHYSNWMLTAGCLLLASFLMLAELIPVPLQIIWVKVFKRRLFPSTPIHHSFEAKGWPESKIVWTFGLVQLIASSVAIYLFVRFDSPTEETSIRAKPSIGVLQ